MFNLTTVIVDSCIESLKAGYRDTYGNLKSDSAALIEQVVKLALENIASSDALYHNVEHTVLVTLVGYVKGICSQDQHSQRLYATGTDSNPIHLELGKTDASLTPHHVDRGKMFIREHFADRDLIDAEAIMRNIELTRFPVPSDEEHSATANYPGLVRAADLIGQLSDPRYLQKMPALFYEFEEIGTNKILGYSHPADLRTGYPKFFWNVVYRYIQDGLQFLEMTEMGKEIIANLYGNVLLVEQEIAATAANLSLDLTPNLRPDSNRSKLPILDRFPGLRDRFVGITQTENKKGFFELFRTKSQLNHPGIRGFQITQRWF